MTARVKIDTGTRAWLGRIAMSLGGAAAAGGLAYLIARAVTSVLLFIQQQEFISEVASAFQGGIPSLGTGNLRAVRLRVQQIDAGYQQISLAVGFVVAALAAVLIYLWLERRAAQETTSRATGGTRPERERGRP